MDYLKLAREAYESAQAVDSNVLAEEHRRYADTCARIAIAGELRKLNERLGNVSRAAAASREETGYVPPV